MFIEKMSKEEEMLERFNALEDKLRHLLIFCAGLKDQLRSAENENEALKSVIKKQENEIKALQKKQAEKQNNFQNQDKIAKIVELTLTDKDNKTGLKEKLDEYIREINQCIEHLSK